MAADIQASKTFWKSVETKPCIAAAAPMRTPVNAPWTPPVPPPIVAVNIRLAFMEEINKMGYYGLNVLIPADDLNV